MKIDEAAQQVNMPATVLRSVNNIPGGMLLKVGSTLLVHRKGALDNDVTEHTAENAQLSLAPEVVLRRVQITARKGDTLASLGARHGVSAASLAGWNRMPTMATLKHGQHLVIFVPSVPHRSTTKLAARSKSTGKSASASKPAKQVAQTSKTRR